jgi:hypothetical protein
MVDEFRDILIKMSTLEVYGLLSGLLGGGRNRLLRLRWIELVQRKVHCRDITMSVS